MRFILFVNNYDAGELARHHRPPPERLRRTAFPKEYLPTHRRKTVTVTLTKRSTRTTDLHIACRRHAAGGCRAANGSATNSVLLAGPSGANKVHGVSRWRASGRMQGTVCLPADMFIPQRLHAQRQPARHAGYPSRPSATTTPPRCAPGARRRCRTWSTASTTPRLEPEAQRRRATPAIAPGAAQARPRAGCSPTRPPALDARSRGHALPPGSRRCEAARRRAGVHRAGPRWRPSPVQWRLVRSQTNSHRQPASPGRPMRRLTGSRPRRWLRQPWPERRQPLRPGRAYYASRARAARRRTSPQPCGRELALAALFPR